MSPIARFAIVAVVLALALGVAWITRRGIAFRRHPASLPPGLSAPVLFTSETCASCARVRRMLEGLGVTAVTEVVWEYEPSVFESAGISRVPAFVWADADGSMWRIDGVAGVSRLRRWLEGP